MLETAQVLAQGYNVFETDKRPSGVVKYLASPQDVIGLIQSGKLKDHILLVRGGTTTFLAPFGTAAGAETLLRVRCINTGLRDDVPESQFFARCLGTVQGWDRTSGQLIVNPLAIFR